MSMRIMHLSLDFPQGLTLGKMYGGMAREKKENLGITWGYHHGTYYYLFRQCQLEK